MLSPADLSAERHIREGHESDVQEIMDTDLLIRSRFAQFLDFVDMCGRTLPRVNVMKHRYTDLMKELADTLHDEFPAERHHGDDPFV